MDFKLSEEQELLLESVDDFIKQCPDMGFDAEYFRDRYNANQPPHEYNKALVESGLGTLGIPERFGGTEVDLLTMVLVAERFASNDFPHLLGAALQIDDMLSFGSEEQLEIVSRLFMEGRRAFSLGITEPQAGSDNICSPPPPSTAAARSSSTATRALSPTPAPRPICSAWRARPSRRTPRSGPACTSSHGHAGRQDSRYAQAGLQVRHHGGGLPGECGAAESALVGVRGNGFYQLMKNFELERLIIAAGCLGMAQCAFNDAAAYANQRIAFASR